MEQQFIVSARKYRPERFDTVVGQPAITRTLKNAIAGNHLAHAYLFCGPRGVGKTTCARILAKTINCTNLTADTEACSSCDSCNHFMNNRSFNIHEMDAASNNHVEDIKNLIDQVRIPPQTGRYSVYIIDEVHMLSQTAFNAFLKTLEEPPAHAIFILATTEKHKILPTILSRCQVFDFHRIGIHDIMAQLQSIANREGIAAESTALNIIAHKADGSMRDALSIYDQVVSFSGSSITYQQVIDHLNVLDYDYYFLLTDHFLAGDYKKALLVFDRILEEGFDGHGFVAGLATHFRDLLVSKDPETTELLEVGGEVADRYRKTAAKTSVEFLYEGLKILNSCDLAFKQSKDPRLLVELTLLSLSSITQATELVTVKQEPKPLQAKPETPKVTPTPKTPSPVVTQTKAVEPTVPMTRISEFMKKRQPVPADDSSQPVSNQPVTTGTDQVDLTEELIKTIWLEFAATLEVDQPRLYNTLITQLPRLTPERKVHLTLNNTLQEKAIRSIQPELNAYLRNRTGHQDIDITTDVPDQPAQKKLYTQQEKYNHLQQKNPDLDLFRQSLDLDLE